ncbi:MAG: hypothetical protein WBA73_02545 [Devosia sp.]
MRAALLLIGWVALLGGSAIAQEASIRETRCWAGDVTFSAGLGIGVGDGVAICEPGSGWAAKADAQVAGCLLEGELSSVGAVVGIRNNDRLLLQCDGSGRWVTIDSSTEG